MTSISQHGAISDEWVHLEDEFPQTPRMEYEAVLMPSVEMLYCPTYVY